MLILVNLHIHDCNNDDGNYAPLPGRDEVSEDEDRVSVTNYRADNLCFLHFYNGTGLKDESA